MSHCTQTIIVSLNRVQQFSCTTTNKSEQLYERQFMVSQSNRQSSSRVTIRKQNYKNEFLTIRIEICFRNPGFNFKCAIDTSLRHLFHYFRGHFSKQNCLTSGGNHATAWKPLTCGTLIKQRTRHFEVWTKTENCKFSNNSESTMLSLPIQVAAPSKWWICTRWRVR